MANKTEVKTYLKYAKIANAAYAFELIYSHEDNNKYFGKLDKVLTDTRSFSTSEAKEFASNYEYIFKDKKGDKHDFSSYQYFKTKYDNGSPEGFKAALLKSKDGYVLAIAGTDPDIGDIGSDYNLAEGVWLAISLNIWLNI